MKALLYEGPDKVELREVPTPKIGPGEALVQVEACGLCGTDLLKIYGRPLTPPVPLGHEVAGRIVDMGRGVKGFKKGDRVVIAHHVPCFECHYCERGSHSMCRDFKRTNLDPGGFSQFVRVSARHVGHTMLKIPSRLDFAAASQVEPLACVLRNVRRLAPRKGDVAVVVGLGSIGLMTAQVLRHLGAVVLGLDLDPARIELAKRLGIEHAQTGQNDGAEARLRALSDGRGADYLIFTVGAPGLAASLVSWLRDGGTLNIFSSFHTGSVASLSAAAPHPVPSAPNGNAARSEAGTAVHPAPDENPRSTPNAGMEFLSPNVRSDSPAAAPLDLNQFYHREINVVSTYSAAPEDLRAAMRLIHSGAIAMGAQIGHTFPLDRFPEAVRRVRGRDILKAILLPQKSAAPASIPATEPDHAIVMSEQGTDDGSVPQKPRTDRRPQETAR